MDAAGGGGRARRLGDEHPAHPQRPDQHEDEGVERDERPDLEGAVEHFVTTPPEDGHEREGREEVDQRKEVGAQSRRRQRAIEHGVGLGLEPAGLELLGPETLHDAHAGDALLDDTRQVAELLLQLERHRGDAMREARRRDAEEGQRAEREQRKRHAARHHHADHTNQDEDACGRERQQDHDLVHLLDVAVGARHQLTGLRVVVEREVQPLEMREQPLAQVSLGAIRDAERGVAPHARAGRLHRPDEDDQSGVHGGLAAVALDDAVVDRELGEQRDGDLGQGPEEAGDDAGGDPAALRAQSRSHEPPALAAQLPLPIHPHSASARAPRRFAQGCVQVTRKADGDVILLRAAANGRSAGRRRERARDRRGPRRHESRSCVGSP